MKFLSRLYLGRTVRSTAGLKCSACILYQHDVFAGGRKLHEGCVAALLRISVISVIQKIHGQFTSVTLKPFVSVEPITMMSSAGGVLSRLYQSSRLANRAGFLKGGCSEEQTH